MYLDKFILPDEDAEYTIAHKKYWDNGGYLDNGYPCSIFGAKELTELDFDKITVIYGGNGSGKTTLLNVIANKLRLRRIAPFNDSELFSAFVDVCKYRLGYDDYGKVCKIPEGSAIITSDDIFDYMLAVRNFNEELADNVEQGKRDHAALKFGETIRFEGMKNYDEVRVQVLARQKSVTRRKFIKQLVGTEVKLNSNGETALEYFNINLKNDTLYCLDEPENSLSPTMQLELRDLLEKKARYCGCQFIIATHSPFILSAGGAKIYNLDACPVTVDKWWQLENTKTYFDFFYKNKEKFLEDD